MNKEIKKLIENFLDLFDDPEIFGDEEDSIFDNKEAMKLYMNNLDKVLIDLIGTDCPKAWKKGKDESRDEIIYCILRDGYGMGGYIEKVVDKLKLKNWKTYKIGDLYAFPYSSNLTIQLVYEQYCGEEPDKAILKITREQQNEFLEQLKDMPDFVNALFKDGTGTYKEIMVSPDNGIMFTFQTGYKSIQEYNTIKNRSWRDTNLNWRKGVIKLTGEVMYDEIDSATAKKKKAFFKDEEKRKAFLNSRIRKSAGSGVDIKEILITPAGLPIGITYFDWKELLETTKAYKQYKYPTMVKKLVDRGYTVLSKFEKEDPNSVYECEKDGLSFKFYKNIDCSNANSINFIQKKIFNYTLNKWVPQKNFKLDSCVICELTDYNLDQYEDIFDTYKKDDQF